MLPPSHLTVVKVPSLHKRDPFDRSNPFDDDFPSTTAILCSVGTIILTFALESVVHMGSPAHDSKQNDMENEVSGSETDEPHRVAEDNVALLERNPSSQTESTHTKRSSLASPQLRAKRLAVASILYPIILTVFTIRMTDGTGPAAFYLVSIIPFTIATFAFLRTLVDCVLVRFKIGLSRSFGAEGIPWMPFMPFSFVVCGLFEGGKWCAGMIMGSGRMDKGEREEDMGEETWGLVGNVDGGESGSEDGDGEGFGGPPAYDEAVGSQKSVGRRA
jgi:hypothetical protein